MNNSQNLEAIVLAGGFGTRLRGAVPNLPKAMALVAGRPFLEHVLDRLVSQGICRVVLSVGYMADVIKSHFGYDYCGVDIIYAIEGSPLGTGGAIAFGLTYVKANSALVLNGDTLVALDYARFAEACERRRSRLGIVVRYVEDAGRYGRCDIESETLTKFSEKGIAGSGFINAGVYWVTRDVFDEFGVPEAFSFEQDFVAKYLNELHPVGFPVEDYFIDIGVPEDYRRAQVELTSEVSTCPEGENLL